MFNSLLASPVIKTNIIKLPFFLKTLYPVLTQGAKYFSKLNTTPKGTVGITGSAGYMG